MKIKMKMFEIIHAEMRIFNENHYEIDYFPFDFQTSNGMTFRCAQFQRTRDFMICEQF